jgi:hypothetical protein
MHKTTAVTGDGHTPHFEYTPWFLKGQKEILLPDAPWFHEPGLPEHLC